MEPKKNPAKDVHRYSKHFFLIGVCISTVLTIMAFEWRSRIQPPPPSPEPQVELNYLYPEVPIVFVETREKPMRKEIKIVDPNKIEVAEVEPSPLETPMIEPIEAPVGPILIDLPIETPRDTFIIVEKMPIPIGGFDAFYKRLGKSIKYPTQAKRSGTDGKVFVEFVINEFGEPVNFKIVKGIGSGCDEEAIRVLKLARWEPGKQRGKPVPVRKVLPVYFKLN